MADWLQRAPPRESSTQSWGDADGDLERPEHGTTRSPYGVKVISLSDTREPYGRRFKLPDKMCELKVKPLNIGARYAIRFLANFLLLTRLLLDQLQLGLLLLLALLPLALLLLVVV